MSTNVLSNHAAHLVLKESNDVNHGNIEVCFQYGGFCNCQMYHVKSNYPLHLCFCHHWDILILEMGSHRATWCKSVIYISSKTTCIDQSVQTPWPFTLDSLVSLLNQLDTLISFCKMSLDETGQHAPILCELLCKWLMIKQSFHCSG